MTGAAVNDGEATDEGSIAQVVMRNVFVALSAG
jgi:hypothetical protein